MARPSVARSPPLVTQISPRTPTCSLSATSVRVAVRVYSREAEAPGRTSTSAGETALVRDQSYSRTYSQNPVAVLVALSVVPA
jgi:hypothetical protein